MLFLFLSSLAINYSIISVDGPRVFYTSIISEIQWQRNEIFRQVDSISLYKLMKFLSERIFKYERIFEDSLKLFLILSAKQRVQVTWTNLSKISTERSYS